MMNKRNTEGYVLAYLLIVITVMGLIAATLMTSTLQVVTAQEKSLVYMQSKYEAMGEIERFVAELDYSSTLFNCTDSYQSGSATDAPLLHDMVGRIALSNLNSKFSHPSSWFHLTPSKFSTSYDDSENRIIVDISISNTSTSVKSKISFSPDIEISDPIAIYTDADSDGTEETFLCYEYNYKLSGASDFTYVIYEISSTGGAA